MAYKKCAKLFGPPCIFMIFAFLIRRREASDSYKHMEAKESLNC